MLILSRRSGESIHLGDDIKVSILAIKGKQVKVGIEVPDDIPVYREEVFKKIQQENEMAIQTCAEDLVAAANIWTRSSKKK
ncbi:MAG: carbon storage regulator [Desulfonatronovibrio sp. MSAO_Bac4]|nr:MAG: carbon storage regulator [Desulfonatronovibrio sp. MSAO_Bac4]